MGREPGRILQDFDAALRRLLDSTYDDGASNIERLLAVLRDSPDGTDILSGLPRVAEPSAQELVNLFCQQEFRAPTGPREELATVLHLLNTIARAEEFEFPDYIWVGQPTAPESGPREFVRRFVFPSMEYLRSLLAEKVAEREDRERLLQQVPLEDEQKRLLTSLVHARRSVRPGNRQPFHLKRAQAYPGQATGASITHPGLTGGVLEVYEGDVDLLEREGVIAVTMSSRATKHFDLTAMGLKYYEAFQVTSLEPIATVEGEVRSHLASADFARRHPGAHAKWVTAANKLWSENALSELTEIGHACREAMEDFAETLAIRANVVVDPERRNTVARVRAVLKASRKLGSKERPFLEALTVYWGTVTDLGHRQVHGAKKEAEELGWEDARRLVFHTALVMYEIDRAVERTRGA